MAKETRIKITADGTRINVPERPPKIYPPVDYTIISIDDRRAHYKQQIRDRVKGDEIFILSTDANAVDLKEELNKRGMNYEGGWLTRGELGVFISVFDCWRWAVRNDKPILVFEDDAIPDRDFNAQFWEMANELPSDFDFMSLWVPKNQYHDYLYDVAYDERGNWEKIGNDKMTVTSNYNFGAIRISKAYQGYGNVAMYYSPQGAQRLIEQAQSNISDPVDCFIYIQAHIEKVNGYSPKPMWAKAVDYDWEAPTTVHNTERFDNGN